MKRLYIFLFLTISISMVSQKLFATLYVPYGSSSAYQAADYWKEFNEIVEIPAPEVGAFEGSTDKTYTVAGTGELMGTDWKQDDADHDMVKGDDGIYRLTLTGVTLAAKDYKYKVTVNHDWGVSYPSSDAVLTIAEAGTYDVTFTFDEGTKAVNAMVNITFADGNVKELCVANWDTNGDGELSEAEAADVTSLGEVFKGNTQITSFDELQYFTGVTSIGSGAFENCTGLTSVTIPYWIISIGEDAFSNCTGLQRVNITDLEAWCNISFGSQTANPLTKAHYLYLNGVRIDDLVIPSSVETILSHAFSCGWFSSVTIPSTTSLAKVYTSGQFRGAKIGELILSQGVGAYAFYYSTINHLVVSPTVTYAGDMAFYGATIDDLEISYSENALVWESGYNSYGMFEWATIGTANVDRYIKQSFGSNKSSAFFRTNISKLTIGSHAIYNYDNLCAGCTITDLFFDGITEISNYAFYSSSNSNTISNIHLPYGLSSIGSEAFRSYGVNSVVIQNETPLTIDGNTFGSRNYATLFVPVGSKAAYEAADYWKEFGTIVEYGNITFADSNVKELCVANWDTDDDGKLSLDEAAAVTSLGEVFRGNTEITSFDEISYFTGLTGFDDDAFNGCSGLTSFTIPSNITSIGRRAFQNCSSLASITIPESVTDIYYHAFSYCTGITSITVDPGNSVYDSRNDCNAIIKTTANQLVAGCKNTIIPDNVTRIGNYAFLGCSDLTSITIPESVTAIGNSAFQNCSNLASIEIPNSVTSIESAAFRKCSSLTTVTVDMDTPLEIDNLVFATPANATLFVPIGSKTAYETADNWKEFGTIVEYGNITFADSNVKELCVANWDTDDDGELSLDEAAAVTSLGEVFRGNTEITSFDEISYFTGLTGFDDDAFNGCSGLTSFTIPNNITSIGRRAFQNCSSLTSISIPNSVTSIDEDAFGGCSNLTKLIVSDIAAWCNIAFNNSYSNPLRYAHHLYSDESTEICNLVIPEGVTSIGNNAFYGCSSLTSVSIPNNVTSIGNNAFYGCSSLTSVSIGNSVTSIGNYAFNGCSSLTSVGIPNSVTSIGLYAFGGNSSLTKVIVSDIAAWCNITIVGFQSSPLYYAHHLYSDESTEIKDLVIPEGVTSIGNNAFYGCSSLTSVSIPNSVTSIGINSFSECSSLTSVSIPNNVTSIGNNAFSGCSSLTSVKVEKENPIGIKSGVFSNRVNATLYVPIGSKAAYEAADYWKEFGTIVEMVGLYSVNHTANRGAEFDLPVLMENGSEAITAFQFDVVLPEGVTLLSAKLSDRKADHGNPVPTLQNDGSYRLTTFSGSGSAFSGSEGTLLNLRVKVSTDAALGEHTVTLKNIELTTTSQAFELDNRSSTITVLDVLTGDASGDGKVSIFDAVQIVNYILGNTPETFLESAADIDGNGKITIFDAVLTVNIILNQGSTNNARITTVDNEREPQ